MNLARMTLLGTHSIRLAALTLALAAAADADVTATQHGAKLVVLGSSAADFVDIDGAGALGEVVVRDNDFLVDTFIGVRDIEIKTGDGDDSVEVSGIEIGGSLKAKLGGGNDRLDIDNTDATSERPLFIGRDVEVSMGGDSLDLVEIDVESELAVVIGRNLTIKGAADLDIDGDGISSESTPDDIFVGGNLRIETKVGKDVDGDGLTVDLDDVNVGGTTSIKLGDSPDALEITDSHFTRKVELKLRGGDDLVNFEDDDSEFNATAVFDGGDGSDTLTGTAATQFAVLPTLKKLEVVP